MTFAFDQAHLCGQFVNGDAWVAPAEGTEVVIESVSPPAVDGRHGWMINPDSPKQQAYDERIGKYDEKLLPVLPHTSAGGESVIKAVSADGKCGQTSDHPPCLRSATVLTVLEQPPPDLGATIFRPPYFGRDKPLMSTHDIQVDLLPSLSAVDDSPSLEEVEARFAEVQLDHVSSWRARYLHPVDSFTDTGSAEASNYGADLAKDNNDAVLRLMLDDSVQAKMPALINVLQAGIDWYGASKGGVTYHADGGHNIGRKIMITFAGVMLDDADIKAVAGNSADDAFSENAHVYHSATAGRALFGKTCKDGMYETVRLGGSGSRDCRDPYGELDGGERPGGAYQHCCTAKSYLASSLAARLLPGGKTVWNADHFHDYADRWASVGAWTITDTHNRTFEKDDIWVTSHSLHGTGAGTGHYGSSFQANMWDAHHRAP